MRQRAHECRRKSEAAYRNLREGENLREGTREISKVPNFVQPRVLTRRQPFNIRYEKISESNHPRMTKLSEFISLSSPFSAPSSHHPQRVETLLIIHQHRKATFLFERTLTPQMCTKRYLLFQQIVQAVRQSPSV